MVEERDRLHKDRKINPFSTENKWIKLKRSWEMHLHSAHKRKEETNRRENKKKGKKTHKVTNLILLFDTLFFKNEYKGSWLC